MGGMLLFLSFFSPIFSYLDCCFDPHGLKGSRLVKPVFFGALSLGPGGNFLWAPLLGCPWVTLSFALLGLGGPFCWPIYGSFGDLSFKRPQGDLGGKAFPAEGGAFG